MNDWLNTLCDKMIAPLIKKYQLDQLTISYVPEMYVKNIRAAKLTECGGAGPVC